MSAKEKAKHNDQKSKGELEEDESNSDSNFDLKNDGKLDNEDNDNK